MHYVILIVLLALAQYLFFTFRVGFTRGKYNVLAPKTAGHDTWERYFRVQQNTMEQLVVFVPGMLAFAHVVSATWVLVPGIAFVIGRALYSNMYIKNPQSRAPGMVISIFSNVALVLGALIGLALQMLAT